MGEVAIGVKQKRESHGSKTDFFFFFDCLWIELQDYKVNSMGQRAADAETSLILQFYPTLDKKKAKKKGLSCSQIFQNQR